MPFRPRFDYSYDAMLRSFEASLQRLGLARIDIVLVHDIGEMTHGADENARHWRDFADGGYRALDMLRASGAIGAIGLGVNEWQVCEAAMTIGRFDCFLLAGRYTLLEQSALESFMPKCAEHGACVIAGGIYNSGILATGTGGQGTPYYNYSPASAEVIARVRRIERLCDDHGIRLADAALQFPLAHPQVACVIPGMGSARRIDDVIMQHRIAIPGAFWSDLRASGLIDARAPVPA
jgi:D-threo-aldose 1-dehydrogenase